MKITNNLKIDLPLAVWLLQDGYNSGAADAPPGELISVTTLMKPTKQLILKRQVDHKAEELDVSDLVAQRMGHALHDSIERSWVEGTWKSAMRQLHYPEEVINSIRINPEPHEVTDEMLPIYLEKRGFKAFEDIIVTGQLDFLLGGSYRDFKSTSTFGYTSGNKDEDFILQGSLYRWIFPELVKDDQMRIEFIFTDWAKYRAKADPKYPQSRAMHKDFQLLSLADTEKWLHEKLKEIRANAGRKQEDMVRCTDKELWKSKDSFKYYSLKASFTAGKRCTKRFDNHADAELHRIAKGKGLVVTDPGEVKACPYCPAFSVCEQRKEYFT